MILPKTRFTMSSLTRLECPTQPDNLCEMFLRDVALLLVTSQLIKRSLIALRQECEFSRELIIAIDSVVDLSDHGAPHLREPLLEAGAVLPALTEGTASAVVTGFIGSIPVNVPPAVLAAEVIANLRLMVHHIELKAMLAAEEAILVGQASLSRALLKWSKDWRGCGQRLRSVTVRMRAKAYVADLEFSAAPQFA